MKYEENFDESEAKLLADDDDEIEFDEEQSLTFLITSTILQI